MKPLEEFITPTQEELYMKLKAMYEGNTSCCKKNYILVHGEAPVMLVAHLDTVHKEPVKHICKSGNGSILMSPQGIGGDDRCGVYALVTAYERAEKKPWLLFTCDEEIGGIGADQFCTKHEKGKLPKALDDLKLIIEIDRKGRNDAVYYDCDNKEFEEYITSKGFETAFGSFSDISTIAPELGVAAVNLSSGYYNAHSLHEYINRKHLNATVRKVVEIVSEASQPDFPKYEYVESMRGYFGRGGYSWGGWDAWEARKDIPLSNVTADEEEYLKEIPHDIRREYQALLDFYSPEELEFHRAENGDNIIIQMFESEFGDWESYYADYGYLDDEEDDEEVWSK